MGKIQDLINKTKVDKMSVTIEDLQRYEEALQALSLAKKVELDLRNKIIKSYKFSDHEGVQHRNVADSDTDADISITLKINRTIDLKELDANWDSLTNEQQQAIEYKPKLVMKNYKALVDSGEVGMLAKAITEKQGQAGIKIKFTEML